MKSTKSRISLRGLRMFCMVAERGSFRLAAEDLYLTPSAISHQIKSLESELDVKLFDRSSRAVRLTEAGETLFQESDPLIKTSTPWLCPFPGINAAETELLLRLLCSYQAGNPE